MVRRILAIVMAFSILMAAGVTGAMAQGSTPTPDAAKSVQDAGAGKSQHEGTESVKKDPRDAIGSAAKGKTASDLAKEIVEQSIP